MNAAVRKPKRAKRPDRPVYLRAQRVVIPETGEERMALLAETEWDAAALKSRGIKRNVVVRAILQRPRNGWMHKVAHVMGGLAKENIEGFERLEAHDALKQLQRESGICCEEHEIDATPVVKAVLASVLAAIEVFIGAPARKMVEEGMEDVTPSISTLRIKEALSIAYDSMDEIEFERLVFGICDYIRKTYDGIPPEALEEIIRKVEENRPEESAPIGSAAA
jgi:hypothetical protein